MEGSESEAIFKSLNLNPQLFINETLNTVDDVVDDAFHFFQQQASTLLNTHATDRSEDLTKDESSGDGLIRQEALCDPDLDAQLESLRNKLIAVEKESTVLNHELQALERHSASNNRCAGFVNEALQLYEQNSVHDFFQEMVRTGSELRTKMVKLKSRRLVESEHTKTERIYNPNRDLSKIDSKGFSNAKLEELEEFLAETKNI
ncbi:protein MIS12 homolog isoform X2 [Alnus glutinosa]|uniref:protein MIS12 homolog isoform X2 n=1 Tax=Alnus glutinosa TaxID=3517 RepID=UPI002D79B115|nr:protein MIS12 homolog isoform X2 [Alnus glutinosa]